MIWPKTELTAFSQPHPDGFQRVVIEQLLSSNELIAEGRELQHCVANYAEHCQTGLCSIWSMKFIHTKTQHVTHALTIEVRGRDIVQARGTRNRMPNPVELEWLQGWAFLARLHIPPALLGHAW